jgi:hypothetical protein
LASICSGVPSSPDHEAHRPGSAAEALHARPSFTPLSFTAFTASTASRLSDKGFSRGLLLRFRGGDDLLGMQRVRRAEDDAPRDLSASSKDERGTFWEEAKSARRGQVDDAHHLSFVLDFASGTMTRPPSPGRRRQR